MCSNRGWVSRPATTSLAQLMDSITQCSAHCLVQGRTNSTSTVMCRRLASSTRLCNSHLKTFSVRNANYNKRIHTLLLDSKGIARLLNLHNVCSTLDKHGGFETAIVSPTTGSVCGAVCWKGGGSGTLEHISDKKRGTDKVKLSFSTFRLDGEQSPDLSPKLSRLLLDDKASSETALAKTAFAYAVTWPSRARDSVGLTNYKNKRKRQPVDSADAHNMYEFFHC